MAERARAVALIADDYAITEGVSRAMLDLIDAGRLTGVSAMASMPGWPALAAGIAARRTRAAIGLHLDLTLRPFGAAKPPWPLRTLILASLARRLDGAAVEAEFERQFDAFEAALGYAPDHVDGHHHVHALPQVRTALLRVLQRRYGSRPPGTRPLLRDPAERLARIARRGVALGKALTVAGLASGLGRRARNAGFATNDGFAGFSSFGTGLPFAEELARFLRAKGPRQLVMCHPGFVTTDLAALDPLGAQRDTEFRTLMDADTADWLLRIARPADAAESAIAAWAAALR